MDDLRFQKEGWPGRHGRRENVHAMLLVRNAVGHGRWEDASRPAQQSQQHLVQIRSRHAHTRRDRASACLLSEVIR